MSAVAPHLVFSHEDPLCKCGHGDDYHDNHGYCIECKCGKFEPLTQACCIVCAETVTEHVEPICKPCAATVAFPNLQNSKLVGAITLEDKQDMSIKCDVHHYLEADGRCTCPPIPPTGVDAFKQVQEICRFCGASMNDVMAGSHVLWGTCEDCKSTKVEKRDGEERRGIFSQHAREIIGGDKQYHRRNRRTAAQSESPQEIVAWRFREILDGEPGKWQAQIEKPFTGDGLWKLGQAYTNEVVPLTPIQPQSTSPQEAVGVCDHDYTIAKREDGSTIALVCLKCRDVKLIPTVLSQSENTQEFLDIIYAGLWSYSPECICDDVDTEDVDCPHCDRIIKARGALTALREMLGGK